MVVIILLSESTKGVCDISVVKCIRKQQAHSVQSGGGFGDVYISMDFRENRS